MTALLLAPWKQCFQKILFSPWQHNYLKTEGRGRGQSEKITLTWKLLLHKGQLGIKSPNVPLKSFNNLDNNLFQILLTQMCFFKTDFGNWWASFVLILNYLSQWQFWQSIQDTHEISWSKSSFQSQQNRSAQDGSFYPTCNDYHSSSLSPCATSPLQTLSDYLT